MKSHQWHDVNLKRKALRYRLMTIVCVFVALCCYFLKLSIIGLWLFAGGAFICYLLVLQAQSKDAKFSISSKMDDKQKEK